MHSKRASPLGRNLARLCVCHCVAVGAVLTNQIKIFCYKNKAVCFLGAIFPKTEMASINARAREEADWEAEWEAMSEAASAEWQAAFAKAAAATERAAADNERLMAAQAQAHQGAEWEAHLDKMVAHYERYERILTAYWKTVWVRTQLAERYTMSEERRLRLVALPFWKWKSKFEENLEKLVQHYKDYGRMPFKGSELGKWLKRQQKRITNETMNKEDREMVESLPSGGAVAAAIKAGYVTSVGSRAPRAARGQLEVARIARFPRPTDSGDVRGREAWEWQSNLEHAAWFHEEYGHMPQQGDDGFEWLKAQRKLFLEKAMREDRMQRVREEGGAVEAAIMGPRRIWGRGPKRP